MIHFDQVKDISIKCSLKHIDIGANFYIVRNVFGRIKVYVEVLDGSSPSIFADLRQDLIDELGLCWFEGIEIQSKDNLLFNQLKESSELIREHVYYCERHLTRRNWLDNLGERISRPILEDSNTKVITFYSFKGGLGRTTTLVLTALQLVKKGKSVVLLDLDLEAPGLASLLEAEDKLYPQYGVIDFLLESQVHSSSINEIDIDEYVFSVQNRDLIGAQGGQLYVMPASNMKSNSTFEYFEKLSRIDFGTPNYSEKQNPISQLLGVVQNRFKPDFIFIDSRAGLHDVGGITLTKFSDIAVLLFYGNEQNMAGMRLVLPRVLTLGIPFYLINGPVPMSEEERKEEEELYLENSYKILVDSNYYDPNQVPHIYDESADHFPFIIKYYPEAALINSPNKLKILTEYNGKENPYLMLSEQILLQSGSEEGSQDNFNFLHEKDKLLTSIAEISGGMAAAELEFKSLDDLRNGFFPLKEHKFIFENDKFLILGPKGSGKSALFSVLEHPEYAADLANYVGMSSDILNETKWITGLKKHAEFPSIANFDSIGYTKDFAIYKNYWMGLVLKVLINEGYETDDSLLNLVSSSPFIEIKELIVKNGDLAERIEQYLYYLDRNLESQRKTVIVTYDALDFLLGKNYRGELITALISLWFEYLTRYKNIKVKIFLRHDIFKNEVKDGITDKVKLKNFTATLNWEYNYLLAMVWKRMAQKSNTLAELISNSLMNVGLAMPKYNNLLGYVPRADEEGNKAILKAIMGEKMGKGNKGYTYNWIRNHLADTNDNIVPRSVLTLFSLAANKEANQLDLIKNNYLIKPKNFELVMAEVSEDRVNELSDEYSEFKSIFLNLKNYLREFPASEDDLTYALHQCGINAGTERTVIDELNIIGVLKPYQRRKSDIVRYHIPDIYLLGMGLSRKGPGYLKDFNKH